MSLARTRHPAGRYQLPLAWKRPARRFKRAVRPMGTAASLSNTCSASACNAVGPPPKRSARPRKQSCPPLQTRCPAVTTQCSARWWTHARPWEPSLNARG